MTTGRVPPLRWVPAFLGLGSNVGDRLTLLQEAVDLLGAHPRIRVEAVSSVYETDAVGPPQDAFLNIAVRVATRLSPRGLLGACAEVEQRLGRVRAERWGPRTIDVDILLYDDREVRSRSLTVPHPRLAQRTFALIPLIEVAPGVTFPDGRRLAEALARLAPVEGVRMVGSQVQVAAPSGQP